MRSVIARDFLLLGLSPSKWTAPVVRIPLCFSMPPAVLHSVLDWFRTRWFVLLSYLYEISHLENWSNLSVQSRRRLLKSNSANSLFKKLMRIILSGHKSKLYAPRIPVNSITSAQFGSHGTTALIRSGASRLWSKTPTLHTSHTPLTIREME